MIREWISGLQFFILLSFQPGAAAKGNFLSLFPPCVRQRLVDSLGLLSLPFCALFLSYCCRLTHMHSNTLTAPLSNDNQTGLKLKRGRQREEVRRDKSYPL